MQVTANTLINAPAAEVWRTITDIDNCIDIISAIKAITVLHKPESGLVGLKWQETRVMFGSDATETMWVTEAQTNEYYVVQAESHGSVYLTRFTLEPEAQGTRLTVTFSATAASIVTKILSFLMAPLIRKSLIRAFAADLADIKNHVEAARA